MELLVVLAIVGAMLAVSFPFFKNMHEDFVRDGASSRVKMLFQQLAVANSSYASLADRLNTVPKIDKSQFRGTATVFEWDAIHGQYWCYNAIHQQGAVSGSLGATTLLSPAQFGYSIITTYEPASLGSARVVGVRANATTVSGLELVPDLNDPSVAADSFIVCMTPQGTCTPPGQAICVNRQLTPPTTPVPDGPWNYWDTAPYNSETNTGEKFPTALPAIIVYTDGRALPLQNGAGRIPANTDPNELIRVAQGHLIILPMQGGGTPQDF